MLCEDFSIYISYGEIAAMAIFHFHARACTKGKGATASAKAAYYGRTGRYAQKADLVAEWSGNMPRWAQDDPGAFWEAADTYERANGNLCMTFEISLPLEFTDSQRLVLAREFAQELSGGDLPYSAAIHGGDFGDQPHLHIQLSLRQIDGLDRTPETFFKRYNAKAPEKGGTQKDRQRFFGAEKLCAVRQAWADAANKALEKAGFQDRISAASLETQEAQGLRPTPDQGAAKTKKASTHKPHPQAVADRAARQAAMAEENAQAATRLADWEERREQIFLDAARITELREVRLGWLLERYGFQGVSNGQGSVMYTHPEADRKIAVSDARDGRGEVFIDNKSHAFHGRGPIDLIMALKYETVFREKAFFWKSANALDEMVSDSKTYAEACAYRNKVFREKAADPFEPIALPQPTRSEARINAVLDWAENRGFDLDSFAVLVREQKIIITDRGSLVVPREHGGYFERRMDGMKSTHGGKERGHALIKGPRYDMGSPLILCEGITDAIALSQTYPNAAIAITGGSINPDIRPEQGQRVYLAFDSDEAGEAHAAYYAKAFPHAERLLPPDGAHDWADWVLLNAVRGEEQAEARAEQKRREAEGCLAAQEMMEEDDEHGPKPG